MKVETNVCLALSIDFIGTERQARVRVWQNNPQKLIYFPLF